MKIVLAGGGTGGHFYPIVAVVEKLNKIAQEKKILELKLYYFSDSPYDQTALFDNDIEFEEINSGKMRTYFSIKNFFDVFKTFFGFWGTLLKIFSIYPDVIFAKGGYLSFPVVLAARVLRIPLIIHESDSVPGRVNLFAGRFARRVAVSFAEAAQFFPKDKTAWMGHPIRQDVIYPAVRSEAREYLKLDEKLPVIWVLGGSQGAQIINDVVMDTLPELVKNYQIIHQVGPKNLKDAQTRILGVLSDESSRGRFKPFGFMNGLDLKMAAGAADLIISRAGSTIFEIAAWGVPSIIVPITESNGDHQRKNAFAYARAGACTVIEESNFKPNILLFEIQKILNNPAKMADMKSSAKAFAKSDAAEKIAEEIIDIALEHED